MKSAEVALGLAFLVISVCNALGAGNKPTNGEDNSVTEVILDDTTVTSDSIEYATMNNASEDDSTVTSAPSGDSSNGTVTTAPSVTSVPSVTQNADPAVNQTATTAPSLNQTSTPPDGIRRRLSTEVDKSKCESLGLETPNAADCKCYKQKSAGTDTPQGFCYYYECPGNPPALSKHKCEWVKE